MLGHSLNKSKNSEDEELERRMRWCNWRGLCKISYLQISFMPSEGNVSKKKELYMPNADGP